MLDAELVGRVFQRCRERKGLSQEVVSSFAEIGRTHLSAIERGQRKPTLGIKASDMMKLIEEEMERTSSH